MRKFVLLTLLSVTTLVSCNKASGDAPANVPDLLDVVLSCSVPENRLALFADLSEYDRLGSAKVDTKSSAVEEYQLSDLLDFRSSKEKYFSSMLFKQIPFMQNGDNLLASIHRDNDVTPDMCAVVKKYLIEAIDEDNNSFFYVVTMIPEKENCDETYEYDFLHKANFSGICLFSMPNGSRVYGQRYRSGEVFQALLINKNEDGECDMEYLSLIDEVSTKSDGESILEASVCIGLVSKSLFLNPSYCFGSAMPGNGTNDGSNGADGRHGPGSAPDQSDAISPDDRLYPVQDECLVMAVSNVGEDVTFACNGHSYTQGSIVQVFPKYKVTPPEEHYFSAWAGDFSRYKSDSFTLEIGTKRQYYAIAYYDLQKPCLDNTTGKGNPLAKMSIASSADWGNWYGGTFGKTRKIKQDTVWVTKMHYGVDFAATPGTPVFSMLDGEITYIKDDSPDENVDYSYGNEIRIKSTFNNATITIQYAHLQYNNAIALDPFTGCRLAVGNKVHQGQLIGYTGRTGNAYNVTNKHLHLGVIDSTGTYIDPADFINGDVDAKNQQTKKGRIDNIICN